MPLNLKRRPTGRKLSTSHLTQQQIDAETTRILAALLGDPPPRRRR